jgi:ABC-2 type transport system ATP-binding protein
VDKKYALTINGVEKIFKIPAEKEDSLKLHIINRISKRGRANVTEYQALKGINLSIEKGEFIGILGRNGAGKSTLLKTIAGIYQPTKGSIKVSGKLVPFIELGVGFNPNLTGRDNIYLNGAMFGFSPRQIDLMYDDIVSFAELENFMDQKLKNYSSGMQVRLAFSLAIRANADILLLDEVLAVGDAAFQQKCYDYFDSLKESNKTIILVSHSINVVKKYCDRAVLIEDGRVAYDGPAEKTVEKYLDLFDPSRKEKKKDKKPVEKIDKKVQIKGVTSTCNNDNLSIKVELVSKTNQDNIKLALRILDANNRVVAGINTQSVINPVIIELKANQTKSVKLSMPNILGNGKFSVDVRVGPNTYTGTIHDKVSGVAEFINTKEEVYYPVALPAKVDVRVK